MFKRASSLLMTAVFLALSIACKSEDSPGHIVRTFQLAIRSAGDFVVNFNLLLGAGITLAVQVVPHTLRTQ